jgi:transcriptional regulator, propionate catabolism operon regulatory protein
MKISSRPQMPHIAAIGYKELGELMKQVGLQVQREARVTVVENLFDEALSELHEIHKRQPIDAILTGGAMAAWLSQRISIPVVSIRISGFDVLNALKQAKQISDEVAVFAHGMVSSELEAVKELLKLSVRQYSYASADDAQQSIKKLKNDGIKVIVSSSLIKEMAHTVGLVGIFIHSERSVYQAMQDAQLVAHTALQEQKRRSDMSALLRNIKDGVASIKGERIEACNPAFEQLFNLRNGDIDLALPAQLMNIIRDPSNQDSVVRMNNRNLVVNKQVIDDQTVILTAIDEQQVMFADRKLRTRLKPSSFSTRYSLNSIIGQSTLLQDQIRLAYQYAASQASVLITGETGTGKELFAQGIHEASPRSQQPFVAINCAAIPESLIESELFGYVEGAFTSARKGGKPGLFELAHTGTLFLDEIGDLPIYLQARLLRVLQEKEVMRIGATEPIRIDVRVIAATHANLQERADLRQFRPDLLFRLNTLPLDLPALRDRPDDIALLVEHHLSLIKPRSQQQVLSYLDQSSDEIWQDSFLRSYKNHTWPGNVRELAAVIERDLITGRFNPPTNSTSKNMAVSSSDKHLKKIRPGRKPLSTVLAEDTLRIKNGNKEEAARALGVSKVTLWRALSKKD